MSALVATPGRTYWVAFALLAMLMGAWAVANPPMASPDEPAHVIKAAAVVRGQLTGTPDPGGPGSATVDVPALYAFASQVPACFVFNSNVPASCSPEPPADLDATTTAGTWVVRNNPLYYAAVGLPTLLPPGSLSFYLMRLVSVLLSAAVLAWGFRAVAELKESRFVGLGLLAAVTPMVLFLGSTVNSSALEISASAALWVALLALLRSPDPARLPVRMAGVAVLAVLLTNARGLSPVFLCLIAALAVASSPWSNFVAAARDRRSWPWIAVIGVGFAASLAWIGYAGTLGAGGASGTGISFLGAFRVAVLQTPDYLTAAIGHFGWLDTALPQWLYLWLVVGVGFPVVLALLVAARRKDALAVAVVATAALAVPVLIQAWQAKNVGIIWQGRYSLPLLVGLPIVAGFVVRRGIRRVPQLSGPAPFVVTAVVIGVGQVCAIAYNLHRYMRGTGSSWIATAPTDWAPPLPAWLLVGGFALAYVALVAAVDLVARRTDAPRPVDEPATVRALAAAESVG